jgi:HK97 family phage major capsid protein
MRTTIQDLKDQQRFKTQQAQALIAQIGDREPTADERGRIDALMKEARALQVEADKRDGDAQITAAIANLQAGLPQTITRCDGSGRTTYAGGQPSTHVSLGQQFIESEVGQFLRNGGHRRASLWRSPSADLFVPTMYGATLTTTTGGGASLIQPMDRGIVPAPAPGPVGVADLMGGGAGTDSNAIVYMVETAYTNAADTVAEGAAKPESTLTFTPRTDAFRKVAHWLPVTEEMLDDAAQVRGYIDSRLRVGITLVEDDQLLNGSGVAPDVEGFRNRTGLAADVARDSAGGESNADALSRQVSAIRIATSMEPDGIVMNPANWAVIETSKDDAGSYLGGGPFSVLPQRRLWGVRVVLSAAMPAGVALVGAFATGAGLYRKGGIRVEASNSHSDFFVKNLVAIRAETRVALAVYRPSAFGEVTGLV